MRWYFAHFVLEPFFSMVVGCFLPSYNHGSLKVPKTPQIFSNYFLVSTISPSGSYQRISRDFDLFAKHSQKFQKSQKIDKVHNVSKYVIFGKSRFRQRQISPPPHLKTWSEAIFCTIGAQRFFLVWLLPFFSDLIHTNGRKFTRKPGICAFLDK